MLKSFLYLITTLALCTNIVQSEEPIDLKNRERVVSSGLELVDIKKYRDFKLISIYNEVLSYSEEKPFGDEHGRSTNVHETVHGINNKLRNFYKITLKRNVNGFYAGAGKGIILDNPPNLTMRDIIPFIPNIVRGYRFKMYFVDQLGDWNDVPSYPIDEWSAYIAGAECAVDDHNHKLKLDKSDYVSGALEFSIYCTALSMAVKDKNLEYWQNNIQFKNTIKYYLVKSEKVFSEGQELFPSEKQDKLLYDLRNHDDTKNLREFLLTEFDGIFVD